MHSSHIPPVEKLALFSLLLQSFFALLPTSSTPLHTHTYTHNWDTATSSPFYGYWRARVLSHYIGRFTTFTSQLSMALFQPPITSQVSIQTSLLRSRRKFVQQLRERHPRWPEPLSSLRPPHHPLLFFFTKRLFFLGGVSFCSESKKYLVNIRSLFK